MAPSPSRIVAALTVLALGALLAGCAAGPGGSPVTPREREGMRGAMLDADWRAVAAEYPEALRPRVIVERTVADRDAPPLVVACLAARGFVAQVLGDGWVYNSSNGQSPLDYAIAGYVCRSSYPTLSAVSRFLGSGERSALAAYRQNMVRPCLGLAGVPISPPAGGRALARWDPYDQVRALAISPRSLRYLEQRCPPVPAWLDLRG